MIQWATYVIFCLALVAVSFSLKLKVSNRLKKQYMRLIENSMKEGASQDLMKSWCIVSISYTDPEYRNLESFIYGYTDHEVIVLLTAPEWLCETMKKKFYTHANIHSTQADWLIPFRNRREIAIIDRKGKISRSTNFSILNYGVQMMNGKRGRNNGM
ncbi:MAG: hypothetical protein K0Q73_8444 [Paenibacillus sp.]|jgi:hypothetical protein|nr:hypothetical protein [Paenibacillus sp.]